MDWENLASAARSFGITRIAALSLRTQRGDATSNRRHCQNPWKPKHLGFSVRGPTAVVESSYGLDCSRICMMGVSSVITIVLRARVLGSSSRRNNSRGSIGLHPTRLLRRFGSPRAMYPTGFELLRRPDLPGGYVTPNCYLLATVSSSAAGSKSPEEIDGRRQMQRIMLS